MASNDPMGLTDEQLAQTEARAAKASEYLPPDRVGALPESAADVPALLAEVRLSREEARDLGTVALFLVNQCASYGEHVRAHINARLRAGSASSTDLVAEVARLRALVMQAERCACCDRDDIMPTCAWCRRAIEHEPTCPAFSAPGVLR